MGENPDLVFNVGAIGIDNIKELQLMDLKAFEKSIDFKLGKKNLLVTFHPVTLEKSTAGEQFGQLLGALESLKDTKLIFTMPNADTDGRIIIQMIHDFVDQHHGRACVHTSLGQLRYLSALQYVDAVVGNSSSGLIEVPYFKKATINIGDRQSGRIMGPSIINCAPKKAAILHAIEDAYSDSFSKKLQNFESPYGNGGVSQKIVKVLTEVDLQPLLKKKFNDMEING